MPIYEYRCQSCNEVMEALVRSGKEPTACTSCGEESLKRLISRAGIIFKGSGFYVNDSKGTSSSSSNSNKSDSSGTKESSSNSDSKSEAKASDSKPAESTSKKESSSD